MFGLGPRGAAVLGTATGMRSVSVRLPGVKGMSGFGFGQDESAFADHRRRAVAVVGTGVRGFIQLCCTVPAGLPVGMLIVGEPRQKIVALCRNASRAFRTDDVLCTGEHVSVAGVVAERPFCSDRQVSGGHDRGNFNVPTREEVTGFRGICGCGDRRAVVPGDGICRASAVGVKGDGVAVRCPDRIERHFLVVCVGSAERVGFGAVGISPTGLRVPGTGKERAGKRQGGVVVLDARRSVSRSVVAGGKDDAIGPRLEAEVRLVFVGVVADFRRI